MHYPMTAEDARRLTNALSESSLITANHANVLKSTLQQLYTLDELQARYGGMGRVELRDLLKLCCVWPTYVSPGRTTRIPLYHVLLVDAVVNRRIDAMKLKPGKVA